MHVTLLKASGFPARPPPTLRKIKFQKFNGRAKSPRWVRIHDDDDGDDDEDDDGGDGRKVVYKRDVEITTTGGTFRLARWFLKLTIFW